MSGMGFVETPQPTPALDHTLVEVARKRREQRDRLVADHQTLTIAMVAEARGVTEDTARQWLHRHRTAGRIVTVQLNDGTTLVPSFQLDLDLDPRPDVASRTSRLLDARMGPWAVWRWWVTHDALLDRSPIEALARGMDGQVDDAVDRLVDPHGG